jgi:hypothetical protein
MELSEAKSLIHLTLSKLSSNLDQIQYVDEHYVAYKIAEDKAINFQLLKDFNDIPRELRISVNSVYIFKQSLSEKDYIEMKLSFMELKEQYDKYYIEKLKKFANE